MIKFINKFIINEDIEKVWEFYTDIRHLEIITPKKLNLKIINTTNQKIILGQETVISAKIMAIPRTWRSKITFFQQYEYIDEMLESLLSNGNIYTNLKESVILKQKLLMK